APAGVVLLQQLASRQGVAPTPVGVFGAGAGQIGLLLLADGVLQRQQDQRRRGAADIADGRAQGGLGVAVRHHAAVVLQRSLQGPGLAAPLGAVVVFLLRA